ncbi:hypothetical protein [Deinococcus sp. UYEF24]
MPDSAPPQRLELVFAEYAGPRFVEQDEGSVPSVGPQHLDGPYGLGLTESGKRDRTGLRTETRVHQYLILTLGESEQLTGGREQHVSFCRFHEGSLQDTR